MADKEILDFAKHLEIGSKTLQMYSETHPRTQRAIQDAFESIRKLLENRESLTVSISEGNLLVDGELMDRGNPILDKLRGELLDRNILSLLIAKGVTVEELTILFRHLLLKPQRVRELGGFEKILADEHVHSIQINKVKYVVQGDGIGAGIDPTTLSVDEFRSLSPGIQTKILLSSLLNEDPHHAASFYRRLPDSDFQATMLRMLDEPIPSAQLKEIAHRIQQANIRLSDEALEKFRQKGLLDQDDSSRVATLADHLLKTESWAEENIAKVPTALAELLETERFQDADQLSKRLFSLLASGRPEQKRTTVEVLPSTIRVLTKNERWKNVDFSLSFLISTCFKKETSSEVLKAYVPLLLTTFMRKYEEQNWTACQEVLSTIKTQVERHEVVQQEFADGWIKIAASFIEHLREATVGVEAVVEGFRVAGRAGLVYLIEMLADEDDQKVRSRLIGFIVSFRSDLLMSELEKRMTDPRWFVVRNMVTVVSKMQFHELPDFLRHAASHVDPRVPKELAKILYRNTKSPIGLLLPMLEHPDRNVRIQAVHLVTMQSNTVAIPALVKLLEQGTGAETELRTACLQALLKLRSVEGIIPAATLLDRKPSSKAEIAERNAAVRLLGELAREQTRTVLEKTAQTDPHPETRALAASYL